MKTPFIFVHGAYHGSWCWEKILKIMKSDGYFADAVDFPSLRDIEKDEITLDDYIDSILRHTMPLEGKVNLVGHSMGGHVISAFAEKFPDKIKTLVYLTAVLLPSGKTSSDIPRNSDEIPKKPILLENSYCRWYRNACEEDKMKIKDYFYNDCSMEVAEDAIKMLVPQPIKPITTAVNLTKERYGSIRRVYIECTKDNVIFPSVQKRMYSEVGCDKVYSLESGHSPFLSCPDRLVSILYSLE